MRERGRGRAIEVMLKTTYYTDSRSSSLREFASANERHPEHWRVRRRLGSGPDDYGMPGHAGPNRATPGAPRRAPQGWSLVSLSRSPSEPGHGMSHAGLRHTHRVYYDYYHYYYYYNYYDCYYDYYDYDYYDYDYYDCYDFSEREGHSKPY